MIRDETCRNTRRKDRTNVRTHTQHGTDDTACEIRLVSRRRAHWHTHDWKAAGGAREFAYDTPLLRVQSRGARYLCWRPLSLPPTFSHALSLLFFVHCRGRRRVHQPTARPFVPLFSRNPPRLNQRFSQQSVFLSVPFSASFRRTIFTLLFQIISWFLFHVIFFTLFFQFCRSFFSSNNYSIFYFTIEFL